MELANEKMRARLVKVMNEAIASDCCPAEYKEVFAEWINNMLDAEKTKELAEKIIPMVEAAKDKAIVKVIIETCLLTDEEKSKLANFPKKQVLTL